MEVQDAPIPIPKPLEGLMQINNNQTVSNANRMLGIVAAGSAKTAEKLAAALRINSAADDAAGLAIAEKLQSQYRGVDVASRNASDSISMMRTGEGALGETHDILQRMRELSIQASNDTYTDSDRSAMQAEMKQLQTEIDRIGNTTEFNTRKLLDGSGANGAGEYTAQVGANSGQTTNIQTGDMRAATLGVESLNIGTRDGAMQSLEAIDAAIDKVSNQRGQFGVTENRLEHTVNYLETASENQRAAESRIKDADIAREIIQRTTNNIKMQATLAMISQGNMARSGVLQLVEG